MRKIFAVTALIICSRSFAQDTTATLEEVTLTASKFSIKTSQTGKVVTIISREEIEKAGSRDLAQVITELGGTFINGYTSNPGKEKNIYLRGAKVDHTLITIDGVPVYDASGIGSNFDIRNLSIDQVERIEILKGSQGTLYGTDAIAGVINIITRKTSAAPQKAVVNHVMNYGSFRTFRSATGVHGRSGWLGYRLGFSHLSSDGISEAKKPDASLPDFEKDAYRQQTMDVSLDITALKGINLQPFARYAFFKGGLDLDAGRDEKDYTNENGNLQTGLRLLFATGKAQWNIVYQFLQTTRTYLDDSLYRDPNAFYIYNHQRYKAHEHFGEAFMVYPFKYIRLTAGIDARASNTAYVPIQKNIFSIPEFGFGKDSVKQNQWGAYAALNLNYQSLSFEAGGRYNHHSAYGSNGAFNLNASYLLDRHLKFFANLSSGYKTPSLYQLFSLYGNRTLEPEHAINMEGGIQLFSKNPANYIRLNYFNREVKDLIAFIPTTTAPYAQYVNQDIQNDQGFEVEASASFSHLQLKAAYLYVDGEITTRQGGKDTTYFNLLRRPKSNLQFFAGYQTSPKFFISAQLNATGKRKDLYFDPVSFLASDITLDPYVLLNLYAEYGYSSQLKFFADLRNVLDKDYMDIYGYSTPGINASAGIRFRL